VGCRYGDASGDGDGDDCYAWVRRVADRHLLQIAFVESVFSDEVLSAEVTLGLFRVSLD
jgi:hypothetical protein